MFNALLSAARVATRPAAPAAGRVRRAYAEWRFSRDIAAIMSTLDRLSDHQLHLIGLRRDDLFETVADLMRRAEAQRAVGREVFDLLERAQPSPARAEPAAEDTADEASAPLRTPEQAAA